MQQQQSQDENAYSTPDLFYARDKPTKAMTYNSYFALQIKNNTMTTELQTRLKGILQMATHKIVIFARLKNHKIVLLLRA